MEDLYLSEHFSPAQTRLTARKRVDGRIPSLAAMMISPHPHRHAIILLWHATPSQRLLIPETRHELRVSHSQMRATRNVGYQDLENGGPQGGISPS